MLCRPKRSGARRRLRRVLCVILAFAVLSVTYFEIAVRVMLTGVIRAQMRAAAEAAVNGAVSDFLSGEPDAGARLASLQFTEGGTAAAITTDSAYINRVKTEVSRRAQENIDRSSEEEGVSVPLGSFTGLAFLSELGPRISLRVKSRSAVCCSFNSTFESAGINQTLHHITLNVKTDVAVYDPFRIYEGISISSDFEIAQTVIVGSVPTYGGVVTY